MQTEFIYLPSCARVPEFSQMESKRDQMQIRQRDLQVRPDLAATAWWETLRSGEAAQNNRNCTGFEARITEVESRGW